MSLLELFCDVDDFCPAFQRLHDIARKCPVRVALETPAIVVDEPVGTPSN